jgi:hypothetical protein
MPGGLFLLVLDHNYVRRVEIVGGWSSQQAQSSCRDALAKAAEKKALAHALPPS